MRRSNVLHSSEKRNEMGGYNKLTKKTFWKALKAIRFKFLFLRYGQTIATVPFLLLYVCVRRASKRRRRKKGEEQTTFQQVT